MTKADFIEKYAEKTGMNKAEAGRAVDAFFATVSDALKAGDKVVFPGVFKAEAGVRPARIGRNPQTGESMQIAEKKVVKAKFSEKLLG